VTVGKGAQNAGFEVQRVEIEAGKIVVFAGKSDQQAGERSVNEWDDVR
jgi:hypothetical protein